MCLRRKNKNIANYYLKNGITCVLNKKHGSLYISKQRGIKPMVEFIGFGLDLKGYSAADLIVGKAVALLFVLAEVKEVYGEVMSESAIKVFERFNIPYEYGTLTNKIINRAGNDICPMEKAVMDIDDPKEAFLVLKEKVQSI